MTGGALSVGGATATGGSSATVNLDGYYDLFMEPPRPIQGCSTSFGQSQLNLTINSSGGAYDVNAYPDFHSPTYPILSGKLSNGTFSFTMPPSNTYNSDDGATFTLNVGERGFTGVGRVEVTYVCDTGNKASLSVSLRVAPDQTPPKLRLRPLLCTGERRVFNFTEFRPEFSELVDFGNGYPNVMFSDLEQAAASVYVIDAFDNHVLDVEWLPGTAIGEAVLRLKDTQVLVGHSLLARLNPTRLADLSGNHAVPSDEPWVLLSSLPVESAYDFDVVPSGGLYGNARYENADSGSSLCESGGCVVLEGAPTTTFADWGGPFPEAMLGVNFRSTDYQLYQARYQLFANRTDLFLIQRYPTGCAGWSWNSPLFPSVEPSGSYLYQTGWLEGKIGLCFGPTRDLGMGLGIGCENCDPTAESARARLVIERIEAIPTQ